MLTEIALSVIGEVPKRAEIYAGLVGKENIFEWSNCVYCSVNVTLIRVGSWMPAW